MHLPPKKYRDLRRYVIIRDLRRIILYIGWLVLFLLSAISYNLNHQTYPDEARMVGWKLVGWMAFGAVLGFFLFRIWKIFSLSYRRGTVTRAGFTHTYTPGEDPGLLNTVSYDFRLKTTLLLHSPTGKKFKLRFEQKTGSYLYYTEGKTLVRYHGLPYPIDTDPTAPHGYVCAACGRVHPEWSVTCQQCGLSLIDPADAE